MKLGNTLYFIILLTVCFNTGYFHSSNNNKTEEQIVIVVYTIVIVIRFVTYIITATFEEDVKEDICSA